MSKTVVSLKTVRKQKARSAKRAVGDANALKHGLSKSQKADMKIETQKLNRKLDRHLREIE